MTAPNWSEVTSAALVRPGELRRLAEAEGALLIGIAGFSGGWHNNPRADAQSAAQGALRELFDEVRGARPVWCMSGATASGIPGIAYEVAEELGLHRVGVTAAAARAHPIASVQHLVVIGERFGDESRVFVELCDRFWLLGGGAQSETEVRMAHAMGTPIVAVRGFGGAADALDLEGVCYLAN